jgi:hypothetical protein
VGSKYCSFCHVPIEEAFGIISKECLKQNYEKEIVRLPSYDDIPAKVIKKEERTVSRKDKEYMFDLIVPFDKTQIEKEKLVAKKEASTACPTDTEPVIEKKKEPVINQVYVESNTIQEVSTIPIVQQIKVEPVKEVATAPIVQTSSAIQEVSTKPITQQVISEPVKEVVTSQVSSIKQEVSTAPSPTNVIANTKNSLKVDNKVSQKHKESLKLARTFAVFVVVLIVCGLATWKFAGNNNDNLQTNNNKVASLAKNDNTIDFLEYTLTVPEGFIYNVYNGTDYIQNDDFVVMFKEESPLGYQYVLDNRDSIISSLSAQGLRIKSFEPKRLYGNDYVLIVGEKGEGEDKREYGYMFGDLGGTKPICATLRSASLDKFNSKWFSTAAVFFASAKK